MPKLQLKNAKRVETYVSPTNNKQKTYVFDCLGKCGREVKKTAYYAKNSTGFCRYCNSKNIHTKEQDSRKEKECLECKFTLPMKDFRMKGNHRENVCGKCKNLKGVFGIDLRKYKEMMEAQNHVCAICKKPEQVNHNKTKQTKDMAVDHCHTTGKIRGLLCSYCNMGVGLFRDNIDNLKNAINYLQETEVEELDETNRGANGYGSSGV